MAWDRSSILKSGNHLDKVLEINSKNLEKKDLSSLKLLLEIENSKATLEEMILKVSDGNQRVQNREMGYVEDRVGVESVQLVDGDRPAEGEIRKGCLTETERGKELIQVSLGVDQVNSGPGLDKEISVSCEGRGLVVGPKCQAQQSSWAKMWPKADQSPQEKKSIIYGAIQISPREEIRAQAFPSLGERWVPLPCTSTTILLESMEESLLRKEN